MATFDGTTLARVRLQLSKEADDTSFDGLLSNLITAASRQVESWINCPFSAESRTETHTIDDGTRTKLFLDAAPVSSITSVKVDSSGQFSGSESTLTASTYTLEPKQGVLHLNFEPTIGFRIYQVVYTGGLAADTAALIAAYPQIAQAIDMQVAYLFQIAGHPHVEQESLGGAAMRSSEPGGLCRRAREVCSHLTRFRF